MAGELRMEWNTLTKAARQETQAGEQTAAVESLRLGATLESGALGKLPSSAEIQATFEEVSASAGEALAALERACESLTDRLLAVRDGARAVDDNVTDSFNKIRGGN